MRKWVALFIALAALAASALAENRVTTTGPTDLHKGPGEQYRLIGAIEAGTRLSYDRTSEDGADTVWYRVRHGGRTGWVSAVDVRRDDDLAGERVTLTNDAKLRSGPGEDYASRMVIDAGTVLDCDGIAEDDDDVMWYRVSCSGKRGWVSSRHAQPGEIDIAGSVTTTGDAKLRSGAGEGYGSRAVVPVGTSLDYDRMEADERGVMWFRVRYGAWRGWISSMSVRQKSGVPVSVNRVRTTGIVHLHTSPGKDSVSMDAIEAGVALTCDRTDLDERGVTWYHVVYNGMRGWISSRYAEVE